MDETLLQFGAGNFLRAFTDLFVSEMNDAGQKAGKIVVVQSTEGARARLLNGQAGRYHVLVRGVENGKTIDRVQVVQSISRALVAQTEWEQVIEAARSPSLRAIVSNTTEAGMVLEEADRKAIGAPPVSFPARLLALLKARHQEGLPGIALLPCELIEGNGDRLKELVIEQAQRWKWDADAGFADWLSERCSWVNSLVDRIVSGRPSEHPLLSEDELLTVTEPYQFWAVEDKPGTEWMNHPAIKRGPDVAPYALRKVRILNGAHTALVAHVRQLGRGDIQFVREAVADPEIADWLRGLLFEEIVPTIADRVQDADGYARQTLDRFANPFLDHKLSDIALHHDKKVPVRLLPTRDEYSARFGKAPARLAQILG